MPPPPPQLPVKLLGLLECIFQHFGVFEQNTDIIKFWIFYLVTSREYCISSRRQVRVKEPANFISHWLLLKTMVHWASDIGELTSVYYAEFSGSHLVE